jgi:hypothetical protein
MPQFSSNILPQAEYQAGVFYVQKSSTAIVLLGSFSSTIASTFVVLFMTLVSYPVAQRLLNSSKAETKSPQEIPTPHQLGLLITLLYGGIGALLPWFKHIFSRPTQNRTVWAVRISSAILMTTVVLV